MYERAWVSGYAMPWYVRILKKVREAVRPRIRSFAKVVIGFARGFGNVKREDTNREYVRVIASDVNLCLRVAFFKASNSYVIV